MDNHTRIKIATEKRLTITTSTKQYGRMGVFNSLSFSSTHNFSKLNSVSVCVYVLRQKNTTTQTDIGEKRNDLDCDWIGLDWEPEKVTYITEWRQTAVKTISAHTQQKASTSLCDRASHQKRTKGKQNSIRQKRATRIRTVPQIQHRMNEQICR